MGAKFNEKGKNPIALLKREGGNMQYTSCTSPSVFLLVRVTFAADWKTLKTSRHLVHLNRDRRTVGFVPVSHRRTPPHMHGKALYLTMSEAGVLNSKWYRTVLYETYKYICAYKHMIQIDSDRECPLRGRYSGDKLEVKRRAGL